MGIPTVLLEGREPTRFDGPQADGRTVAALVAALQTVLESAVNLPSNNSHLAELPIRSRYVKSENPCELEFRDLHHRQVRCVALDSPYYPHLKVTRRATLPHAYAASRNATTLIALLARHGLTPQPVAGSPDNHLLYPVTPEDARLLAVYLEQQSKYGLCRYPQLGLQSVLRVEHTEQPLARSV